MFAIYWKQHRQFFNANAKDLCLNRKLTFKDGLVIISRALDRARLSLLLVEGATGDVSLDNEAVALSFLQIRQLYHAGFGFVHSLQTTQRKAYDLERPLESLS